jgi:hypothetical protein
MVYLLKLTLEDPARFIKQLDSVNRNRRMKQNPVFHGIDEAGTCIKFNNATNRTEIFLGKQNNMITCCQLPFCKR